MGRETLLLSMKRFDDGRWMGVISRGGHPVLQPELECEVLDAQWFLEKEEVEAWFAEMEIARPWDHRH